MRLIVTVVLILSLVGCSLPVLKKVHTNQDIENVLKSNYADLGSISGFKRTSDPNIYQTTWIVKIHKLLDISLDHKKKIADWALSIDIFDKNVRDKIGIGQIPLEIAIITYLELFDGLDMSPPTDMKNQIIKYYRKTQQQNGLFQNGNQNTTLWVLNGYYLLKEKITQRDILLSSLRSKNDKLSFITKCLLLTLLDEKLSNDEMTKFKSISLLVNENNLKNTNDAYSISYVARKYNIKPNIEYKENTAKKILDKYMNLEPLDPKYLFQWLFICNLKITIKEKEVFENFFKNMFLKDGWIDVSDTLDINSTFHGLAITKNQLSLLNVNGLNNYLTNQLDVITSLSSNNNLIDLLSLRILALDFKYLNNDKALSIINNKIKDIAQTITPENINPITIGLLGEVNFLSSHIMLHIN